MPVTSTLREVPTDEALEAFENGAALVDLRPVDEYLVAHVRESLSLAYERGPGFPSRARDCIPLDVSLILVDDSVGDLVHAAASLRGKGFDVLGFVARSELGTGWPSASSDVLVGADQPEGFVLDVGDPGATVSESSARIPIDRLWTRAGDLLREELVVISAGAGVRAAMGVGILERAGIPNVSFWKTRA